MNEWCAETAMHKVMAKATPKRSPVSVYQYSEGEEIPIEAWEQCVEDCITLYEELGDEIIPFFQYAERELEDAKKRLHDKMSAIERMKIFSNKEHTQSHTRLTEIIQ